jgi:DNA-binding helix-hairpin-helix protein with protein kinase domain
MHLYYSGNPVCPWCNLETKTGILLYVELEPVTKFDLSAVWQKITSLKPPGPLPVISPKSYSLSPKPLPPGLHKSGMLTKIFSIIPGKARDEKIRRRKKFETCRKNWVAINQQWKKEADDEAYKTILHQLTKLKQQYESLEKEHKQALVTLQTTARERQLKNFLSTCFIDNYPIPHIGVNRKATLRSFGIETAADISYVKIQGIPGFGDALTQQLFSWRQQMESKFKFDPSKSVDKTDIQVLKQKFMPRMRPLERQLIAGIEKITHIQQNILKCRGDLRPLLEASAKEFAQAHADLKLFRFI